MCEKHDVELLEQYQLMIPDVSFLKNNAPIFLLAARDYKISSQIIGISHKFIPIPQGPGIGRNNGSY
jgi:hypothetical protein